MKAKEKHDQRQATLKLFAILIALLSTYFFFLKLVIL
jgi:hypothetical protein